MSDQKQVAYDLLWSDYQSAVSALESIRADRQAAWNETAGLRAEVERLRKVEAECSGMVSQLTGRVLTAEATNARLRELIRRCVAALAIECDFYEWLNSDLRVECKKALEAAHG